MWVTEKYNLISFRQAVSFSHSLSETQSNLYSQEINFIISHLWILLKTFVYDQLPHPVEEYFRALCFSWCQLYCSPSRSLSAMHFILQNKRLQFPWLPAICCFSFSLAVQLGAEGVASWESVLCGPQHQNHNLGETTATGVRLQHSGFCVCVCVSVCVISAWINGVILPCISKEIEH